MESARLAFARERDLWTAIELDRREDVRLKASAGKTNYMVSLDQHLLAIQDEGRLITSVLIHSYALAESAALDHLQLGSRSVAGVEDWGTRLLSANSQDWSQVLGGFPGAVEVAVARNAFAHGNKRIDVSTERRFVMRV